MPWRDLVIERSKTFAASCRAFGGWLDRGYGSFLEFAPDSRRDARLGAVASATFHLLLLAAIFFGTYHHAGGSGSALRSISVDIVMQQQAGKTHAPSVPTPTALAPEPIEPNLPEMNLTPLLPSIDALSAPD